MPVCKAGTEAKEVAAIRHTPIPLRCEVDSPTEAGQLKFSWTFNQTRNVLPVRTLEILNLFQYCVIFN